MTLKKHRSYLVALGIVAVITVWMASGMVNREELTAVEAPVLDTPQSQFSVQIQRYQNQMVTPELVLHGQTEPSRQVGLSSEVSGKIISINKREGEFIKAGEVIIQIDTQDKPQRLKQAKALVKQRELEFKANQNLINKGLQNETQLAQSEALLAAANADLKQLEIQLASTKIKAPFSGVLENRKVEIGTYVQPGDPLISILDYDPFLISAHVSEKDVAQVHLNKPAYGRLISGQLVEGRVRYVSSVASTATRTFEVELEVANPSGRMANGLTADILLPLKTTPGILVSPALLTLNDQGVLGIKYVNENNEVVFGPVSMIKTQSDGVWIAGLPDQVDLITVGQSFVSSGDKVHPVPVPAKMDSSEVANKLEAAQP